MKKDYSVDGEALQTGDTIFVEPIMNSVFREYLKAHGMNSTFSTYSILITDNEIVSRDAIYNEIDYTINRVSWLDEIGEVYLISIAGRGYWITQLHRRGSNQKRNQLKLEVDV
ncbi:MAG: hypothetical protein KUG64_10410 [Cycloclasticus sp.]|nr:hypothetical protein [Cycloclasticus sp.]